MKNLKVSMKLIVGFLIVIALALAIGITGIIGMHSLNKGASDLYDFNLTPVSVMGDFRELFANERNDIRNIFLSKDDPEKVKSIINGFSAYDKIAEESFATYEKTIVEGADESAYYEAKKAWTGPYATMKKEMFALLEEGKYDEAYAKFTGGTAVIAPITNGFATSTAQNDQWALEGNESNDALYRVLTIIMIAIIVIAIAIALFLAFYISSLISNPLSALTAFMKKAGTSGDITLNSEDYEIIKTFSQIKDEIGQCIASTASFINHLTNVNKSLEAIADGDLTVDLKLLSKDDSMGVSLQKMTESLNQMFTEINASSSQVTIGAGQVANGSQSLAQGATEQAASVEQLSSSITEIAGKTKQSAKMADEAATLSSNIKNNAEKGSEQMDQLMCSVTEINEASQSISKVIKVIDDIAFQTNILALNAAVEAARAGQHGKGFAVVAEEVRNLASKSAEAAKDTGGLIENSIEKAGFGLTIATETTASLKEIVDGINQSAEIIADIAQSADEQSNAVAQINIGIDQVSQVIQQNSATAEESAAASEEMSSQATLLQELITRFKIKNTSTPSMYAAPNPPPTPSMSQGMGGGKY